jgi:hypothetical protein
MLVPDDTPTWPGVGDALQFPDHTGEATAHDIETLGETVRMQVKENSGIELQWEIKRIGIPA